MTLEVLISTIGDGIYRIPELILSESERVRYLVSWQVDDVLMYKQVLTMSCFSRHDVRLFTMKGKGLSRNRNNCLSRAEGDVLLIADDDCRYTEESFKKIITAFEKHEADVMLFQSTLAKSYPDTVIPYRKAMRHKGYYVSSMEMAMKRSVAEAVSFNEDYGLGSGKYICGEEDVFLKDAEKARFRILYIPAMIVETQACTTGSRFITDPEVQKAKGAVFRYVYSPVEARYRTMKEVLHHWVFNKANPLTIYKNMTSK